ncbi:MAG: HAD family hydrolase [Candidatus Delongbacteria bacterium]
MSGRIVFTDFDGTFIKGDSYFRSLLYFSGYKKFFRSLPELIRIGYEYYSNFITRDEAKKKSFELIFKGMSIGEIDEKLEDFNNQLHTFPKVKSKIDSFRKLGCKIIVVTASPDIYMSYISKKRGFDGCICTETEKDNGILTGRLKRKNCNYAEKVLRIKESEFYDPEATIISFGNSRGDEEMFRMSSQFYFVDRSGSLKKGKTPW